MEIEHIKLQYDRLQRHYNAALKEKDAISFLDFSHALRVWVEMKHNIDAHAKEKKVTFEFKSFVIQKPIKDILKGSKYTYLPLASGVPSPGVEITGFRRTNRAFSPEELKKIVEAGPPIPEKNELTYSQWIASGIYDVPSEDPKHPKISISREILIKRVANILGASHPQGTEDGDQGENKFDKYIKELHSIVIGEGYPATYYQLLEIGKDILDSVPKIFIN